MATSSGFECTFIGEVKDFECPLCLHVTRNPSLTSCCGQHFCENCINRVITNKKPCPFCKESEFTVFLDKKQKRKVLELEVKCTQSSRKCKWTGQLGNLEAHVDDDCGFVEVSCPKECGTVVQRRKLVGHLTTMCPKRCFTCKYCGYVDTYQLIITEHIPKCPKYPVPCPNNCSPSKFEQQMLEKHTTQDCPLQQVDCEFWSFGCTTTVPRRDLAKHMEEDIQHHLLLMTKELKLTKEKLLDAEQKFVRAEETIASLMTRVADLEDSTFMVPLTFSVHNFSQLEMKAKAVGTYTLFTHTNGYKLRLTCAVSYNTLGFILQKADTENNQTLRWPLRCAVHLTLLNQAKDQNHIKRSCCVHVENNSSITVLKQLFIKFTEVSERRSPSTEYVCHDRLLFKVDIVQDQK